MKIKKDNKMKLKYVISNHNYIIGRLWEDKNLGKVLVTTGENIDINFNLTIHDLQEGKEIEHVDLKEFLLTVLSKK
jgi:hypothetical protein